MQIHDNTTAGLIIQVSMSVCLKLKKLFQYEREPVLLEFEINLLLTFVL